jgi:peptidyl-prolyl cis-trans isomerase C
MTRHFRFILTPSLCCAAVCLLGQCRKSATTGTAGEPPLAVVAGQPITAQDLRAEAEWRIANNQFVPESEALLKEMVNRRALIERAKQTGMAEEADTRRRIESLLIARLREKQLDAKIAKLAVTDEEVTTAYKTRADEFSRKGLDRFAILFQAAQQKMSEARRAEARQRLEAALALADSNPAPGGRGAAASGFGAVAIDHSDDQTSRYRGGDIGWIETTAKQTRWPESLLVAGRALKTGARSNILECDDGFYVIMKTDSRPGGDRPLAEIAERLRQGLLREKQHACEERFIAQALELAKVEIHGDAARKVTLPVGNRPSTPPDEPPGFPGIARPASASR